MSKSVVRALLLLLLAVSCVAPLIAYGAYVQKPPVRHIVMFKYKPGATPEQIAQVTAAFRALQQKIPGITAFEDGVNNSPEGKNLGFTHVYMLTFESVAARDAYLPHPEHGKFGQFLGTVGIVADAFVVDYTTTGR
jgi:hypothetical protein